MTPPSELLQVLRATGFMIGDIPAPGLVLNSPVLHDRIELRPDAIWRDRSQLQVVFKCVPDEPPRTQIASWHRDVWNLGLTPLLWVVSPKRIRLYNAYERPKSTVDAGAHLLWQARMVDEELSRLDEYAGRLAMTSGRFWSKEDRIQRGGRVDAQLLFDLQEVENQLSSAGLPREVAQGLLGRSIFVRYLADREIVGSDTLNELGFHDLKMALRDHGQAYRLFDWVRSTFNGDLFPVTAAERNAVTDTHLSLVSETLAGVHPNTGQRSLWEYRFDIIPIELISSIYEQFAHGAEDQYTDKEGLHYTPISLVNLVLDEVMGNLNADARVLDITCGSGVFLVEALRRLVSIRADGEPPSRKLIRDTLSRQVFGVDKNEAAIRVASFSLYLAALELDPDPTPPEVLRFEPLIGRNLFIGNAFDFDRQGQGRQLHGRKFDVIVGNPPWTYDRQSRKLNWPGDRPRPPLPPRSQDFAFVWRSIDFSDEKTRFGMVMRATPFFSGAESSVRARIALLDALKPIALVNLSALRDELFPTADYPAVVLFARLHNLSEDDRVPIVTIPWTSTFSRSGSFEIASSDVRTARLPELSSWPQLLKATALGTPRDRLLLRRIESSTTTLRSLLEAWDISLLTGVQTLSGDRNDASHLIGLPFLDAGRLSPHIDVNSLPLFDRKQIHRPRAKAAFVGPLVLVGEGLRGARLAVGVSDKNLVYTRSFYGISFANRDAELALRFGGILLSAVASWNLLLTGSEFGIHKRKVLRQDLINLPTPSPEAMLSSDAAPIGDAMEALWECNGYDDQALKDLDSAVFDVYELEPHERLVVLDGLARAKREYTKSRSAADWPTTEEHLRSYATAFLSVINAWQVVLGREAYSAEILGLRQASPFRIIRFVVRGDAAIGRAELDSSLNDILAQIGARIRLPITEHLAAIRELRVHAGGELLIIKPAARRYWTPATGLNDADSTLGDGLEVDTE